MSNNYKLGIIFENGLKEANLSEFSFADVRKFLEQNGYELGTYYNHSYHELADWIDGWELYYSADIFKKEIDIPYVFTGYSLTGSLWYGNCNITRNEIDQ